MNKKTADVENQNLESTEENMNEEEVDKAENTETCEKTASQENEDIEALKAQLEDQTKKSEEYFGILQRTMAEFDNYKKRTVKEKENIYSDAVGDTISQLLPVLDNLERAVNSCKEGVDSAKLLEGVEMVLKQFNDSLSKLGVEEIKAKGEIFNPELHNAVMHIEDESVGENIIVEEFQKGYKIKDKVIRHSMVKVAN
ncbi:MAG: GrpE protein [Clostridia bacterium]|uniref:nucleotide exchange factor GrpE n=1 Tax=Petroclostridium xylanilyticum TaxID=1792311 RepID=UPI001FA8B440|nr:nucleotide exchange factor GrpE [Petroclostridium xylanilyticum]MBZ4644699.1 GrpE protein [Clostridia bacterium]